MDGVCLYSRMRTAVGVPKKQEGVFFLSLWSSDVQRIYSCCCHHKQEKTAEYVYKDLFKLLRRADIQKKIENFLHHFDLLLSCRFWGKRHSFRLVSSVQKVTTYLCLSWALCSFDQSNVIELTGRHFCCRFTAGNYFLVIEYCCPYSAISLYLFISKLHCVKWSFLWRTYVHDCSVCYLLSLYSLNWYFNIVYVFCITRIDTW